VILLIIQSS